MREREEDEEEEEGKEKDRKRINPVCTFLCSDELTLSVPSFAVTCSRLSWLMKG